jgi:uncharacterized protein (TIGR02001 family)
MIKKIAVLFILISFIAGLNLHAGLQYGVDITSRVIWRGMDLFNVGGGLLANDRPALQPNITYAFGDSGFSLQLFATLSFNNQQWKNLDELDLIANYDFNVGEKLSLSAGLIHYGWYFAEDFEFKVNTFQELYLAVGFPKLPLNPTLTFYYYIKKSGEPSGWYLMADIAHSFKLSPSLSMDVSASLGYNYHHAWIYAAGEDDTGLNDFNVGVAFPMTCGKVSVTPFIKMAIVLMEEINPLVDNEIWFGVSFGF